MTIFLAKKITENEYILADKFTKFTAITDKEFINFLKSIKDVNTDMLKLMDEPFKKLSKRGYNLNNLVVISLKSSPLISAQIEITRKCNLNCSFCFQKRDDTTIPKNKFRKIIDSLEKLGVVDVCLHGGEIFVLDNVWNYLLKCKDRKFRVSIITNGTLLKELEVKKLKKIGIGAVFVSLDGPQNIHERLRGKGTFRRTIRCINSLVRNNVTTYILATPPPEYFIPCKNYLSKLSSELGVAGLIISNRLNINKRSSCYPNYPLCEKRCYYKIKKELWSIYITAEGFLYRCPFLNEPPLTNLNSLEDWEIKSP